jgi:RNA polymerase-interacting CarD/CdnL/TRCF family regulator
MDSQNQAHFQVGDEIIYALHGKCRVLAVENREIGEEAIPFYKLEVMKSNLSRSTKQEPNIWLPVNSAPQRGLRPLMTEEACEEAIQILNSREFYFNPRDSWNILQPLLERTLHMEGGAGMAKVFSFLHVLKQRQIVPTPEVQKLFDGVSRVLFREICETLKIAPKTLEDRIRKGLRQKLAADQ